jgi:hypothetical protein
MNWRRDRVIAVLVLLGWASLASAAQPDEIVWQWFQGCTSTQEMHVVVQLSGRALYSNTFPVCTMRRADVPADSPQKILEFSFRARAALFGPEFARLGPVDVEANIWRAGGEADALLLGVSFATPDRVLLNSVHIARARRAVRSTMAKGLVVHTSAARPSSSRRVEGRPRND